MRQEVEELLRKAINDFTVKEINNISKKDKFIQSIPKEYTLNNGEKVCREEITKGGSSGSAVIVVPEINNKILAAIEPRVFTELTVGIGFPAGYINEGEEPIEAAKRELKEETGCIAKQFVELDAFYQDEGCSRALNRIFIALGCEKKYSQKLDKDEYVKCIEFTYDELLELEKRGYIMGGNSKLALTRVEKYFKEK